MKTKDIEKYGWIAVTIIELIFLYLQFEGGAVFPVFNIILVVFLLYAIYNRFKKQPVSDSERSSEVGLILVLAVMGLIHLGVGYDTFYLDLLEVILCIALGIIGFKNIGKGEKA